VFEPRRFVELRKKDFVTQALSAESFGMGIFYTVNVFWIQFYLGAGVPHMLPAFGPCDRIHANQSPDIGHDHPVYAQQRSLLTTCTPQRTASIAADHASG
jgi:hypothetical protein